MTSCFQPGKPRGAAASRRQFLKTGAALGGTLTMSRWAEAQTAGEPPSGLLPRSIHPYPNRVTWGSGTFGLRGSATLTVVLARGAGILGHAAAGDAP
jgi:hypothetical protein